MKERGKLGVKNLVKRNKGMITFVKILGHHLDERNKGIFQNLNAEELKPLGESFDIEHHYGHE